MTKAKWLVVAYLTNVAYTASIIYFSWTNVIELITIKTTLTIVNNIALE